MSVGIPTKQNGRSGAAQTTRRPTGTWRQIGGSAHGYQAVFVPSTALASPGYDGQPAAGRDQVAGGQAGGPAGGLPGDRGQRPRRLVFPGAPGRQGMKAPMMVPGQLLPGIGRDDPARRRRLPVQSQEHGASLTLERLFTDPRRP